MSRRQGRISNRGNAKVGAGSRRSEYIGSPGKHREIENRGNAQKCQPGQEQDFAVSACESAA